MPNKEKVCPYCKKVFIPKNSFHPCDNYECYEKHREQKAKEKKERSELKKGIVSSITNKLSNES